MPSSEGSIEEVISRFIGILPLTALAAIGVYNALYLARRENEGGRLFATVLAVLGLGLIIGAEFLFIRDFFNNRGNTGSSCTIRRGYCWRRRPRSRCITGCPRCAA